MTESLFSPCFLWWLKLEWWVLDQTYHYQEQGCTTTMQCNVWYSISKLYCVDCSCYSSYLISMSRQHNDGGHNRWHEKIVCCLDMLISRPYIKWRVWSTPDTLIHITAWEQWPQHQMYRHYFLGSTWHTLGFEFWIQCSLDGIKFQIFVYTEEMIDGQCWEAMPPHSPVCSVFSVWV